MKPFCSLPKRAMSLNLLFAMAARRAGLSSSYCSTLRAVQIVLDRRAVRDDPALVELAGRLQRTILSGQDVVERGRLTVRSDLRVGMPLVVDELVLVADGRVADPRGRNTSGRCCRLRRSATPTSARTGRTCRRDDVELAARVVAVAGIDGQQPVFDLPPRAGGVGLLVAAPAVESLAVEEQRPAGLLLLRRELVLCGSGGAGGFLRDGRPTRATPPSQRQRSPA